ncbi:MAG: peptidoglycan-binding protein [Acidobacteria bacterium]|nr:peptidoglycan-binding protein [Acidobacteriota bacterium]
MRPYCSSISANGSVSTSAQHVVRQGECLVKIASQYGFQDYRAVYGHAANGEFRRKRPNPNVIYPGDVIVIPPKQVKEVVAATGKVHRFVMPGPKKVLRLRLRDAHGEAIANEAAAVTVDGEKQSKKTDGDGLLIVETPIGARAAVIEIRGRKLPVDLSHLNPVSDVPDDGVSGVQHRLRNLGYYSGPETETFTRQTRLALWLFQFDHDLKTDGRPTAETIQRLVAEHGC